MSSFYAKLAKKNQSQTITREKLRKTLSYEKAAGKMLVKSGHLLG